MLGSEGCLLPTGRGGPGPTAVAFAAWSMAGSQLTCLLVFLLAKQGDDSLNCCTALTLADMLLNSREKAEASKHVTQPSSLAAECPPV